MTGLNPCLKMISAPELKTFAEHVNEPLPAYGELPPGTDANMKGSMKAIQRAALRARQVAEQTGTDLIVVRAGQIVHVRPQQKTTL